MDKDRSTPLPHEAPHEPPPAGPFVGSVRVPGDKSCTQRALLLGAVAEGTTEVVGALAALDTLATAAIVAQLGAGVWWGADVRQDAGARQNVGVRQSAGVRQNAGVRPDAGAPRETGALQAAGALRDTGASVGTGRLSIRGVESLRSDGRILDCANAGTAARLLMGLLAGHPGRWILDGDASLRRRPMGRVAAPLRAMGAEVSGDRLPLTVVGAAAPRALLTGMRLIVSVPSAQVKSALLLAGLRAEGPTTVVQHVATRDHTERMLRRFGIRVDVEPGEITVHPGRPRATALDIPGDPSSAAFLLVAALLTPGSDVWVTDVGLWPRRTGFLRALQRAGADCMVLRRDDAADGGDPRGDVRAGSSALQAFDIAPEDVPDLVDEIPILALAAARARGTSRFAGLAELALKESDRIAAIAELLDAFGVPVEAGADSLAITGVPALRRPSRELRFDDHRLALTAAVACASAGFALPSLQAADVSFPGFADTLRALRSGDSAQ